MQTYILINRLANAQRRAFDRISFRNHYSAGQGRVLHFILTSGKENIFQKDIEMEFGMQAPSVTSLIKTMEKNGLIRREALAEDARYNRLLATEKGKGYEEELKRDLKLLNDKLITGVSDEELEIWKKVSGQIIRNLKDD